MSSNGQWLSGQIKGYVMTNIPSWGNIPGNVSSNIPMPSVSTKPPLTTNYIWASYEGDAHPYIVEDEFAIDPATVKPKYEEIY